MAQLLELVKAKREIAKLKSIVSEKQQKIDTAEKQAEMSEKGIKDALKIVANHENVARDCVMYVNSRELERFRGKPEKSDDLIFLVVKDPVNPTMQLRKHRVPGILGSNVLRDMQKHFVTLYGNNLLIICLIQLVMVKPTSSCITHLCKTVVCSRNYCN